jgi:hypothetical protein
MRNTKKQVLAFQVDYVSVFQITFSSGWSVSFTFLSVSNELCVQIVEDPAHEKVAADIRRNSTLRRIRGYVPIKTLPETIDVLSHTCTCGYVSSPPMMHIDPVLVKSPLFDLETPLRHFTVAEQYER